MPVYPVSDLEVHNGGKVVSTEGCYSCNLNGESPRKARSLRKSPDHPYRKGIVMGTENSSHLSWGVVKVTLPLRMSQALQRILRIQPAYKHLRNESDYLLLDGNDRHRFQLVSR